MKKLAELYAQSWKEMRHLRTMTTSAMFMAISVVLGYFTIEAGPYLKIGLGSVANQFVYYLFGPVTGMFYAGILDILKYAAKPTAAFFPGFTLIAMLGAMIYGPVLYRRPITFGRVLFAKLLVALICNVLLNTWCLSFMYGKGMAVLIGPRLLKNLIMWPVDSVIFFVIVKKLEDLGFVKTIRNLRTARRIQQ